MVTRRGVLWLAFAAIIFIVALTTFPWLEKKTHVKIGITQIVSHPGLDLIKSGVIEGLKKNGYEEHKNIEIYFRNANGDPSLTSAIASAFVREKMDLIIPITTPSSLAVARATNKIPIVFGGVTDPVKVGLVKSLENPGGNITGTSDRWPIKDQFKLFKRILPSLSTVGILYKPGDDISKIGLDAAKEIAPNLRIKIISRPVSNASDIYSSATALFREVDAIYTGMDQLVVENLDALLKAAKESNKPVLSGDEGGVPRGAIATTAISMFDLGINTGEMAAKVLDGKKPGSIPVRVMTAGVPIINKKIAEQFDVDLESLKDLNPQIIN